MLGFKSIIAELRRMVFVVVFVSSVFVKVAESIDFVGFPFLLSNILCSID